MCEGWRYTGLSSVSVFSLEVQSLDSNLAMRITTLHLSSLGQRLVMKFDLAETKTIWFQYTHGHQWWLMTFYVKVADIRISNCSNVSKEYEINLLCYETANPSYSAFNYESNIIPLNK